MNMSWWSNCTVHYCRTVFYCRVRYGIWLNIVSWWSSVSFDWNTQTEFDRGVRNDMWNVKLSDAIWYYVIWYNIIWYDLCCDAMRCDALDRRIYFMTGEFCLVLSHSIFSYPTLLYLFLPYFVERNEWVTHDKHRSLSTIPYRTVLYCTVLHCTVLYCAIPYCGVLYSTNRSSTYCAYVRMMRPLIQ